MKLSKKNNKVMVCVIENLVKKRKPFLIIKYSAMSCGVSNVIYEVVYLSKWGNRYHTIDRRDALHAMKVLKLPLLHKVDNRHMIWGDENFKEEYKAWKRKKEQM